MEDLKEILEKYTSQIRKGEILRVYFKPLWWVNAIGNRQFRVGVFLQNLEQYIIPAEELWVIFTTEKAYDEYLEISNLTRKEVEVYDMGMGQHLDYEEIVQTVL